MEVSIRDLKDHLSEYPRRARTGEEIVVTSRGEPVARLVGPHPGAPAPEMDAVARLRARPWIRSGNGQPVPGSGSPATIPAETTDGLLAWVRGE